MLHSRQMINMLSAMPILKAVSVRLRAPLRSTGIVGHMSLIVVEECLCLERGGYMHSFIWHITCQVCLDVITDSWEGLILEGLIF